MPGRRLHWLGPGRRPAKERISLAALGMHARDTCFRVICPSPLPAPAVGVHDYYAHARDAAMPGMQNMPIGGEVCMTGMRRLPGKLPVERWPPKAATISRLTVTAMDEL